MRSEALWDGVLEGEIWEKEKVTKKITTHLSTEGDELYILCSLQLEE